MALLQTFDLTVGYRQEGKESLMFEDLNIVLEAGQLVCFMGPNGIGKSTLIRTLAGLQKPLRGSVTYQTDAGKTSLPKKVSVVLTDRIGSANLTVGDLITFGRYPYLNWSLKLSKEDKIIIDQAIEQLRIRPLLQKKVFELSDGQLQMAMIARALVQDTHVILLDEPTSHLDLNNRVEIMNLLRTITRETGKGVLVATHELDLALQTADLIWLAGTNRDILSGIPEDLVLNNTFDDVFRFKGFDLKTGKIQHTPFRNLALHLSGKGHAYLWTKNALERNGYRVTNEWGEINICITEKNGKIIWEINSNDSIRYATSIQDLLKMTQSFAY